MSGMVESDTEYDVVVLGAGAGGMTAALVASLEGLKPLLVEKSRWVGGTMSTSAGTIWIPGNTQSRDAGMNDTASAAATYMDHLIGQRGTRARRDAYLETGPEVVDYLRSRTTVRFTPSGKHPDYQDLPGAAVFGRALAPEPFDGRLLGEDFERVRPPIPEFMIFGGMMVGKEDIPRLIGRYRSVSNFVYAAKLFLRYLRDRRSYSRGTRVAMGNALAARFLHSLKQRNVPIWFESTAEELIKEGDRITGVVIKKNGVRTRVKSRLGIVIATGGYGHHDAFRKQFMPSPTPPYSLACQGNTGDGIELAVRAGAALDPQDNGPGAFWTPVSILNRPDGTKGVFPHLSLDRAKPGLIAVNAAGVRFVNEGSSYHDFVEGMYASYKTVPTLPVHLICDVEFIRKYGLGIIYPGTRNLREFVKSGYIYLENSLAALAGRIGVDPNTLRATIERHNEMAVKGEDSDFGKGSTELSRFNGDPANKPNPCLRPISGPYVALPIWPAEIGTSSGIVTDEFSQVLNTDGSPIGGLYVCGNDMASIMEGTYPGPGTTLGPALVFGYRAIMHAMGRY